MSHVHSAVPQEDQDPPRWNWREVVARYQTPSARRSIWQLCSTLGPLLVTLFLMYFAFAVGYWLVLLLGAIAGGFLVRTFIIMHDCGHGSFFRSKRANDIVGFITGVLTLTPYVQWRRDHAIHHATSGDLDHRGLGDITTLTVREYLSLSTWKRIKYRLYRNPLVLLGLGPVWLVVEQRLKTKSSAGPKEVWSVRATNLTLLALFAATSMLIGPTKVLLIYLPAFMVAGASGIYLFYVQHQFEETYWAQHAEWDYATAAIRGSSYYRLPAVLNWFTGSIGLHHVHHLSPKIPNYRLRRCHEENPAFHEVRVLTLWESIKTLGLKLWDEENRRMVGFGHLRRLRSGAVPSA